MCVEWAISRLLSEGQAVWEGPEAISSFRSTSPPKRRIVRVGFQGADRLRSRSRRNAVPFASDCSTLIVHVPQNAES